MLTLGLLSLLMGPLCAQGALDAPLDPRLQILEKQRSLRGELRSLEQAQRWAAAARTLVSLADLEGRVPAPFEDQVVPAEKLLAKAAGLRLRFEQRRAADLSKQSRAAQATTSPTELVEALDKIVRSEFQGDDLARVFRRVLERTATIQTKGLVNEYGWGQRLRRLLPRFPCAPERLKGRERVKLKEEWQAASMSARRQFLTSAVLEARAFVDKVSWLPGPGRVSLARVSADARSTSLARLQAAPEGFENSWVKVQATWVSATGGLPQGAFPFKHVLAVEELDARLLVLVFYDRDDQATLMDLGRLKLIPAPLSWARSYPARSLEKKARSLQAGDRVSILARLVACPRSVPGHVLEVWKLERSK